MKFKNKKTSPSKSFIKNLKISGSSLVVSGIIIISSTIISHKINTNETQLIKKSTKKQAALIKENIRRIIELEILALKRMVERLEMKEDTLTSEWQNDAKNYITHQPGLKAVAWINKDFKIRWMEPSSSYPSSENSNFINEVYQNHLKFNAANKKLIVLPIVEEQGNFHAYFPIYKDGKSIDGYILGIFNIKNLIENIIPKIFVEYYGVAVNTNKISLFKSGIISDSYVKNWGIKSDFNTYDIKWHFTIWPKKNILSANRSGLPLTILISGIILALIIFLFINFIEKSRTLIQKFKEGEDRLTAILEPAPDGILLINEKDMIQSINKMVTQIFGYGEYEIIGQKIGMLLPFEMYEKRKKKLLSQPSNNKLEKKKNMGTEIQGLHKNGESIPLEIGLNQTIMPDGSVQIIAAVRDITQRKKVENKLKETSEKLKLILNNTKEGIYGLNLNMRITFVNHATLKMLGHSTQDILNLFHKDLIYSDKNPTEKDRTKKTQSLHTFLKEGTSYITDQKTFCRKNGTQFPAEYTLRSIQNEDGQMNGAVVVFRDITERKKTEMEKEQFIQELARSNEELDNFAYVASHDLKAPLRVIDNASRWLEEDLGEHLDEESKENMQLLRTRVKRMEKLLDDLLEYSRIGRKTDERFTETLSGDELMQDVLLLLSPSKTFQFQVSPKFAEIQINRMPLQQIMVNLINNAIKHHDKEKGNIEVTVEDQGDHYTFAIKDDGPGIPKKFHNQIFKMFQTLKPRDRVEGSGMGLAMVHKHIEYFGGQIKLKSTEGKGSTFYFNWPKNQKVRMSA